MMLFQADKLQIILKYRVILSLFAAFFIPLKLIAAYFFLVPALLLWGIDALCSRQIGSRILSLTALPLLIFAVSAALAAFFGIDPLRSLEKIGGFALLAATIPLYLETATGVGAVRVLCCLLAGQAVAALHTVLEAAFPLWIPALFLGKVTESGQLALSLVTAIGLIAYISIRSAQGGNANTPCVRSRPLLCFSYSPAGYFLGCLCFLLLCLAAFPLRLDTGGSVHFLIFLLAVCLLVLSLVPSLAALCRDPRNSHALLRLLLGVIVPLLSAALLVNLKRGPWAGVLAGLLILIFLYGRRQIFTVLAIIVAFSFSLPPVYQRLANSADDFFISGGRAEIWQIGTELVTRYPLGVGYKNSSFLRSFSSEIPPQLTHFHNNILNIAVETGWISLAVLLWWLYLLLRGALSCPHVNPDAILRASIGCALISWQVAGMVEYNFGDSEVWLMALLMVGVLSSLMTPAAKADLPT